MNQPDSAYELHVFCDASEKAYGAVIYVRETRSNTVTVNLCASSPPKVFGCTDSTTVLHWLDNLPGRWQTFVANRVAQIQEILPRADWYHVPTDLNSADLASRGVPVAQLSDSDLWWHGPEYLQHSPLRFPVQPAEEELAKLKGRRALSNAPR